MAKEQKKTLYAFIRYASFSVLGMLGVSCYILADTFFVARGMGSDGLAALNLAIPVYNLIHGCALMFGMGAATKYAIYQGQKEQEKTDRLFTNTLYFTLFFALLFVAAGVVFPETLARWLGAEGEVLTMTTIYLRWLLLFAPAFMFNEVFLCFVRNDGGPRISMIAMLVGSFANIFLDYLFIFPCRMGIFGAIFATGLSPVISMVIMSSYLRQKKNHFHLKKTRWKWEIFRQTCLLGFPSFLGQVSTGIVMVTFNFLILGLAGTIGVAAYGVVANISLVVVAVYTGISQGMQPLVSRYYGVLDRKSVGEVYGYAQKTTKIISGLLYLGLFLFAPVIGALFNHEGNAAMHEMAVEGIRIYFLSSCFVGYNTVVSQFFPSVDKPLPAHILSLLRGLLLVVPLAFLLSGLFGMKGIWLTCPVTECVVAGIGSLFYLRWKKNQEKSG